VAQHPSCGDEIPAGCGVVEVRIQELSQLFDSLDPSPFHQKDLDRTAEEYIVSSLRELSSRAPAALVVYLDQPAGLPEEARTLRRAIHEHFARKAELSRRELRQLLRRGWSSLAIGLSVLGSGIAAGSAFVQVHGLDPLSSLVRESLHIGGWVAMWKPMEIFLYDWWPLREERHLFERLSRIAVRIVYTGQRPVRRRGERRRIRLLDEETGRELGRLDEGELAFLRDVLEEEGADDRDFWVHAATVEWLARRPDAPPHLLAVLRRAVRDHPDGIDVLYQRPGEPDRRLSAGVDT
jgi:hypothetical protein